MNRIEVLMARLQTINDLHDKASTMPLSAAALQGAIAILCSELRRALEDEIDELREASR